MQTAFQWFNIVVIGYYGLFNLIYTGLMVVAVASGVRQLRRNRDPESFAETDLDRHPPVTIIFPVHDAQDRVIDSVSSLMELDYPSLEILVINDGSQDETLSRLLKQFDLKPVSHIYRVLASPTQPVRGFYQSPSFPRLIVIDKEHGGKADALNVGVNFSRSLYICALEEDILLEKNALLRMVRRIREAPSPVIAIAGVIGIKHHGHSGHSRNGCPDLPCLIRTKLQLVEYLKRWLFGRMVWGHMGLIIGTSSECVLFHKRTVQKAKGYDPGFSHPNLGLLLKLHRILMDVKQRYLVIYDPGLIGWKILPYGFFPAVGDGIRWQKAMVESVMKNWQMLLNFRYGWIGAIALPLLFLTEILGPFLETLGYVTVGISIGYGWIDLPIVILFVLLAVVYSSFLALNSVLIEALIYQWYRLRSSLRLAAYAILESLGYRQMVDACRLWAVVQYLSMRR